MRMEKLVDNDNNMIQEVYMAEEEEDEELMMVDNEMDIPDDDDDDSGRHPLAISMVASNILSYLSYRDLKSCRLVCRAWEEETRIYLSDKVKVVLNSEDKLKNYIYEFIGNRGFFDTVQLGPYMYMGNPLAERFFELYGLYIKHLILLKTHCSAIHLREIMFRFAPNIEELSLFGMTPGKSRFLEDLHIYDIPNLQNLKGININLMLTQGEELLRDFLYDLFSVSPNLEKIAVPRNTYKGFVMCLISTLLESRDLPLENLCEIDTLFSFGDSQIQLLTSRGFPLESLNMQLMPNVTLDHLLPLLESLNPTLKNLRLYFYLTNFKELPSRVRLDRVEQLTLDTYHGSLMFTSHLPELKELTVTMKSMNELTDAFPREDSGFEIWTSRSLRSFRATLSVVEACETRLVDKIYKSFPCLKSISLQGLDDNSLRMLLLKFPNLEELNAPQGIYTDKGLTGMLSERTKFLSASINLDEPACISNLCRQYNGNLVHLSKLRVLRLQSQRLTDASIFFAVLHCKELKELCIERSDVTDRGIDAIINFMDLHRFSIILCTRVSGPQLEVVKDKMKNRKLNLDFDEKRYSMYD